MFPHCRVKVTDPKCEKRKRRGTASLFLRLSQVFLSLSLPARLSLFFPASACRAISVFISLGSEWPSKLFPRIVFSCQALMGSQHPSPDVTTLCNFEPEIWPETIISRDAESTCLKGPRTSCDVINVGIFWPNVGRKRSHHVMDASCRPKAQQLCWPPVWEREMCIHGAQQPCGEPCNPLVLLAHWRCWNMTSLIQWLALMPFSLCQVACKGGKSPMAAIWDIALLPAWWSQTYVLVTWPLRNSTRALDARVCNGGLRATEASERTRQGEAT